MMGHERLRRGALPALAWMGVALAGCSGSSYDTQPVSGKVVLPNGDAAPLAGHLVEVVRPDDPTVRASGMIRSDGSFELETLQDGKVRRGAKPGNYRARLILSDEGDGQAKKPVVAARFLDHKTSGWTVQVPATEEVKLTITPK